MGNAGSCCHAAGKMVAGGGECWCLLDYMGTGRHHLNPEP